MSTDQIKYLEPEELKIWIETKSEKGKGNSYIIYCILLLHLYYIITMKYFK